MDFPPSVRPTRIAIDNLLTPISSPKRKRDYDSDSDYDSPRASPMRFRTIATTELPSRPRSEQQQQQQVSSPTSPRSKVSRQLNDLKLNKPDLGFSTAVTAFGQTSSSVDSSGSWNTSSPPTEPEEADSITVMAPIQSVHAAKPEKIPSTPTLAPSLASATLPVSPKPLSSPIVSEMVGKTPSNSSRMHSPPPSEPTDTEATIGSSNQPNTDLTWTAAEITGHNPTDPTDDGYGINGVGFRPTSAMAYARTQRRKQQVAEWKTREAKEARQKRMDRRKKSSLDLDDDEECAGDHKRKVRFADG